MPGSGTLYAGLSGGKLNKQPFLLSELFMVSNKSGTICSGFSGTLSPDRWHPFTGLMALYSPD